jgi:hypothetical protein
LPSLHPADNFRFRFDGFGGGERTVRNVRSLDNLKFSRGHAGVKIGADLGMGDHADASAKAIANQRTFIHNRLAFKVLGAGKG